MQQADHKLRKAERLKSRKEISELFEKGIIIHQHPFKVLFKFYPSKKEEYPAKIAVSVSKKNFKHAVDRNHLKRKIRESYRQNKQEFYSELKKNDQNASFFVIYTANNSIDYKLLNDAMAALLKKITMKIKS